MSTAATAGFFGFEIMMRVLFVDCRPIRVTRDLISCRHGRLKLTRMGDRLARIQCRAKQRDLQATVVFISGRAGGLSKKRPWRPEGGRRVRRKNDLPAIFLVRPLNYLLYVAHYRATSLFEDAPMPTFVLFVECDPVPSAPLRSIQVAARDADEAECAADAIADFAFASVAQNVTIYIHDLATAREIRAVRRPVPISI
jgi:hypothetical protein